MRTGADVSMRACRAEGYPVVEHGRVSMDPDAAYSLTISNPRHWPNGRLRTHTPGREVWSVNTSVSYTDLWAAFLRGGESIRKFCDFDNCPLRAPEASPDFHDFVTLAGILNGFGGLDEFCWGR